jgi:hypothetical protein
VDSCKERIAPVVTKCQSIILAAVEKSRNKRKRDEIGKFYER